MNSSGAQSRNHLIQASGSASESTENSFYREHTLQRTILQKHSTECVYRLSLSIISEQSLQSLQFEGLGSRV